MSTIVSQPKRRDILLLGTTAVGLSGTALPFGRSLTPRCLLKMLPLWQRLRLIFLLLKRASVLQWFGGENLFSLSTEVKTPCRKFVLKKLRIYVILKQMKTVYKKRNGLLPLGFALTWDASRWGKKRETQEVTGEGGFVFAMVPIMINQGESGKDLRRATLLSRPTLSKQIIFSRLDKKRYE